MVTCFFVRLFFYQCWPDGPLGTNVDFDFHRLSFYLQNECLCQTSVSHENHLIFMRMTVQVTYIFIPIVSLKDSFCQSGKSKLGIGLFIHELLREPLIILMRHKRRYIYICLQFYSSIASFVWKPEHFDFQSYGGA